MKKQKKIGWGKLIAQVVSVSPAVFFVEYLASMVYGISLALTPMCLSAVFQDAALFARGSLGWQGMLLSLGKLFGMLAVSEITAGLSDFCGESYAGLTKQKLFAGIHRKIGKIPAIEFEKPEMLNIIEKSYAGAYHSRNLVNTLMDLLTMYLPYFCFYGWYLYTCAPVLPLALVLIFLPVAAAQVWKGKVYAGQAEQSAPLERKKTLFARYLTEGSYVKETRSLGAQPVFREKHRQAQSALADCLRTDDRRMRKMDAGAMLLNLVGYVGVLLLLIWCVTSGRITVAAFAAVFASIRTACEQMEEMLDGRGDEISESAAKAKNYLDFLNMPVPEAGREEGEAITSLELRHVSFSYPDGSPALRELSFTAGEGDCIAVVGENGSGKTTLSRLLSGLYVPEGGEILYNGRQRSASWIQSQTSQCFQQYNRYEYSLRDNVNISAKLADQPEQTGRLLREVCLAYPQFPKGLDTQLGRSFGGTELSGGQWQRLALARANRKPCSLLILDEPTAAIDALAETELYQTFRESCRGRIGLIVTHRLGVVQLCSKVLVLREGRLLDFGTHEELLRRCGYYKTLWQSQADMYREDR